MGCIPSQCLNDKRKKIPAKNTKNNIKNKNKQHMQEQSQNNPQQQQIQLLYAPKIIDSKYIIPINEIKKQSLFSISTLIQQKQKLLKSHMNSHQQYYADYNQIQQKQLFYQVNPFDYPFSSIGLITTVFTDQYYLMDKEMPQQNIQPKYQKQPNQKNNFSKYKIIQNTKYATAFLITHNIALTAAHNIYLHQQFEKEARKITIKLGINGKKEASFQVVYAFIPKQFKLLIKTNKQAAYEYDYALLVINSRQMYLGQKYGYLPIKRGSQDLKKLDQVYIYGFFNDLNQKQSLPKIMYGSSGKIKNVNKTFIYHQINTNKGQSGFPILKQTTIQGNKIFEIIGIHLGEVSSNKSLKISEQIIQKIDKWIYYFNDNNKYFSQKIKLQTNININQSTLHTNLYNLMISQWQKDDEKQIQKKSQIFIKQKKKQIRSNLNIIVSQNFKNNEALSYSINQTDQINYSKKVNDYFFQTLIELKVIKWNTLKQINLENNILTKKSLKILMQYKFKQLKKLNLSKNPIQNSGFKYIIKSSLKQFLLKLQQLILCACYIGQFFLKAIKSQDLKFYSLLSLKYLKILDLSCNQLIDQDIQILFTQQQKYSLKTLSLQNNLLNGKFIQNFIFESKFVDLQNFFLRNNKISIKKTMKLKIDFNLSQTTHFKLKQLYLYNNNLCLESIQFLVSSKILQNLQYLQLQRNYQVRDQGAIILFKDGFKSFPLLQHLMLIWCDITDNGIEKICQIQKQNNLTANLSILSIVPNKLKDEQKAIQKLKSTFLNTLILKRDNLSLTVDYFIN